MVDAMEENLEGSILPQLELGVSRCNTGSQSVCRVLYQEDYHQEGDGEHDVVVKGHLLLVLKD